MKKLFTIFIIFSFIVPHLSFGAVNVTSVKKAAPVKTQKVEVAESATSLLPSVIGLVSSVATLKKQQQQLGADCAPTSSEIELVNDLVKEWAKTGTTTATAAYSGLGDPCNGKKDATNDNENSFKVFMENADTDDSCYETFTGTKDKEMIWAAFPKASSASVCDPIDNSNCHNSSNIYEVFYKIPFTEEDYTISESKKIAAFKQKAERCSPTRIKSAKRELVGNFLTQTISNVGQTTGTAGTSSVMNAVMSMGGSGDVKSMLPSLGSMATQMIDK